VNDRSRPKAAPEIPAKASEQIVRQVVAVQRLRLQAASDGQAIMPRDRCAGPGGRVRIVVSPAVTFVGFSAYASLEEIVRQAAQVVVEGRADSAAVAQLRDMLSRR
jgi:hypothetical protein